MAEEFEGGCSCGAVRYRLTAKPMFVHCCHCLHCQRESGSAFVLNGMIETACIEVLKGTPVAVPLPTESGNPHDIHRCPHCQTAVWSDYGHRAFLRFVRLGTLDDPSGVAPDVHIFTRTKLPWVELPKGVPAFDIIYDRKTLWPAESLERLRKAVAGR